CGDIVLADRAPMNLAGSDVSPALDSGEQALDAGAVAMDYISRFSGVVFKSRSVRLENRNQVLGTRTNVDVRLLGIAILREPVVCLPSDGWDVKGRADAERPVARAGVVG